jgi:parvulin-like peptidyl-prolyl isomerase
MSIVEISRIPPGNVSGGEYNLAGMNSSLVSLGRVIILLSIIWSISACGEIEQVATPTVTPIDSPVPTITQTSIPPTATVIPMAAMVNGVGITLEEYEAELSRYLSAQENESSIDQTDAAMFVLEDLITQVLFAQAAEKNSLVVDEEILQVRIDDLIAAAGGELSFGNWLRENGYSQQSFNQSLRRSIMGAWMRDKILAEVPRSAEQVYVRQILLFNSDQANQILAELESGKDFATLAASYEPVSQGELGWFPRDFLPHPAIEEAAFNLAAGEYSSVIETSVGYHIIQIVEKDPDHPLSPEARLVWQENALRNWVAVQREQSNIIILSLQ